MRFNPPPGWPVSTDFVPGAGWTPDPSWPPAPAGWQFFIEDPRPAAESARPAYPPPLPKWQSATPARRSGLLRWWPVAVAIAAVLGVAGVAGVVVVNHHRDNGPEIVVLKPVDAQGNIQPGWVEGDSDDTGMPCWDEPSPYDKTAGVRYCAGGAAMADACWPADSSHVLCLRDPFSRSLSRITVVGLDEPQQPLTTEPIPLGLQLDDGSQCRTRIGGALSAQQQHPDWIAYYYCTNLAIWAPADTHGITKGPDGWTVEVGTDSGPLSTRKVVKALYVGVATPGADDADSGGTTLVTRCGRPPRFEPEEIRTDSGALIIRTKIVAECPGGDVITGSTTRISVTAAGQNIASGTFDLSGQPIVIAPDSGGSKDNLSVEHEFRFPPGTFWRLPVSTSEVPTGGASQSGAVDLDAHTLLIDCQQSGSTADSAAVSAAGDSSTASGPADPASGDRESASFDALRALANADRPFVTARLADRWVPQLSSKQPGLVADGKTWANADILDEHLRLRLDYPEVRLLWSGDWSTFSKPDFWVTIAGVTFADADAALGWCRDHRFDRDHCYAKLVSTTHPVDGSTAFNP